MTFESSENQHSISIVIASFDSAPWLPSTLASLAAALEKSTWRFEVIIVDDGSTDDTVAVVESIARDFPVDLRLISQENRGRFLARWAGAQAAIYDTILLLDSRLIVGHESLEYLQRTITSHPDARVWNGHVLTDPSAPLVGHFWSVPTHIFWSEYLANPRPIEITPSNFDRVPKGTGFLLLPKSLFERACLSAWPTGDAHLVSDDTKVLRFVVNETPIRLDPGFSAIYRPRTTFGKFLAHSRDRGTLFVDSYAGTSTIRNVILVALVIAPPLALVALSVLAIAGLWTPFLALTLAAVLALALPALLATTRRCPPKAIASYLTYVVPFGIAFWLGLSRGVRLHRKSFATTTQKPERSQR